MKKFCSMILVVLCLSSLTIAKETRIYMDCYINSQPVKLAFDTGTEWSILFRQTAERLKLSIKKSPKDGTVQPGELIVDLTEEFRFQLTKDGIENFTSFGVVDSIIPIDIDGVIGWGGLKNTICEIDPYSKKINFHEKLKINKSQWKSRDIRTDMNVLVVKTAGDDTTQDSFLIDTGYSGGFKLRKGLWEQITANSTDTNTTLHAIYAPSVGLTVNKEKWIREVSFGGIPFHDIPISTGIEANQLLMNEGIDGILGMWGLSCYTWIVDGPAGKIYFKKSNLKRLPKKYSYNRLGAVFVPEDIRTSNSLIAHVIQGSPADNAGIANCDELLKIGQLDVAKWRTDPNVLPLGRFFSKPTGTEIKLELMRNGEKKKVTVKLEEIFK